MRNPLVKYKIMYVDDYNRERTIQWYDKDRAEGFLNDLKKLNIVCTGVIPVLDIPAPQKGKEIG